MMDNNDSQDIERGAIEAQLEQTSDSWRVKVSVVGMVLLGMAVAGMALELPNQSPPPCPTCPAQAVCTDSNAAYEAGIDGVSQGVILAQTALAPTPTATPTGVPSGYAPPQGACYFHAELIEQWLVYNDCNGMIEDMYLQHLCNKSMSEEALP